ncbi:MAG: hypothetical protein ACKVOX_08405, partial [Rhizobacter sp.]
PGRGAKKMDQGSAMYVADPFSLSGAVLTCGSGSLPCGGQRSLQVVKSDFRSIDRIPASWWVP